MSVNLIITTYSGLTQKYVHNIERRYYLRYNLILLNSIKTNIDQITIMKPRVNPEHLEIPDYYNFSGIDISNIKDKIKIIECENIGISYGQFFTGIFDNLNFDYYIFIEDDYIISKDYFESFLIDEFNKNSNDSVLCALIYDYILWDVKSQVFRFDSEHNFNLLINNLRNLKSENVVCSIPDFSLCILSKHTINKILLSFTNYENIMNFFNINFQMHTIYIHQILFGYVLNIANINIHDYSNEFLSIFYETTNNIITIANHKNKNYNDSLIQKDIKLKDPIFIPIDILYPNDSHHQERLNTIIENLIDKTEFSNIFNNFNNLKKSIH